MTALSDPFNIQSSSMLILARLLHKQHPSCHYWFLSHGTRSDYQSEHCSPWYGSICRDVKVEQHCWYQAYSVFAAHRFACAKCQLWPFTIFSHSNCILWQLCWMLQQTPWGANQSPCIVGPHSHSSFNVDSCRSTLSQLCECPFTVAVKINAPPQYNMTEWNYVRWHNNMKCVNIFQDFLYKILWQSVKNWRSYVWFICILLTR